MASLRQSGVMPLQDIAQHVNQHTQDEIVWCWGMWRLRPGGGRQSTFRRLHRRMGDGGLIDYLRLAENEIRLWAIEG